MKIKIINLIIIFVIVEILTVFVVVKLFNSSNYGLIHAYNRFKRFNRNKK